MLPPLIHFFENRLGEQSVEDIESWVENQAKPLIDRN